MNIGIGIHLKACALSRIIREARVYTQVNIKDVDIVQKMCSRLISVLINKKISAVVKNVEIAINLKNHPILQGMHLIYLFI